jgi:metallophosphoesterase (TIGR00282 family)
MSTILFMGDIVGEPGLSLVESHLPTLIAQYNPDFVVANAENMALDFGAAYRGICGMYPEGLERLWAAGVDLVTGGNHSWDGPHGMAVHNDDRVLRPLNYGHVAPGRGAAIITKDAGRLGVINIVSRTALPYADNPFDALEAQLHTWDGQVDAVLVDYHGESVNEKLTAAFIVAGQVAAVVGTHTHIQTADTQILPSGTAYVSDVGMIGPGGGIQGYDPQVFINRARLRLGTDDPLQLANGSPEFGAVFVTLDGANASAIKRLRVV